MKKSVIILLLIMLFSCFSVEALNYKQKELIPVGIKTTIAIKSFNYQGIVYQKDGNIYFDNIRNISTEELPISITVGLFDKKEKNIGTVVYCAAEEKLASKEEKAYSIPVKKYLGKGKKLEDIRYIAVIGENTGCSTTGKDDFLGKKVDEIGVLNPNPIDDDVLLFLKVVGAVGVVIILSFLYKFFFTNAYENMDGEDIRKGYKEWSEENSKKLKAQPKPVKEKIIYKSEEIKKQEEKENTKDKNDTDLHQLYK